jgi:lantibiotic transport system permease protein
MMLIRALRAEVVKLKRTIALALVVLAPFSILALTLFMASQAPFGTIERHGSANAWRMLTRLNLQFWALLMLPLYCTLQTALLAGLDHSENQWKALLARPVPKWTHWVAKLIVVIAMVVGSAAILAAGVVVEGFALNWYDPKLGFGNALPIVDMLQVTAQATALAALPLVIQHWVSLRWRSFSVAMGFGMAALITSFAMLMSAGPYGGAWPQYFPWSLPMLVLSRNPQNVESALIVSFVIAVAVGVLGCLDFCRREVT